MATFNGKSVTLNAAPDIVFDRLSNLSNLQSRLEQLPPEIRAKAGEITFTPDSITISAAPAGQIVLAITERKAPERIVLSAENSPLPLALTINIAPGPTSEQSTVHAAAEVDIPAFARPFVGPKMQEAADRFSDLLQTVFNAPNA